MCVRTWTWLSVGALLLALQTNNANAAQSTNQTDRLGRPSRIAAKPHGPQPIYLTPKVAEILRLNKASVSDDVIVAYIEKSPSDYAVTARELISLHDAGLSERVLKSLAEHRSPAPEELLSLAAPTVAPEASGRWLYVPGSGWCWQSAAPSTQPYGGDAFSQPLIYGVVSDGGTAVVGDGHHHHYDHHVEHHNQGDQLATGHQTQNTGGDPYLPIGGQLPSGKLPPYGIAGQPLVPNSGAYPYLPVGGQPASGNLPPYGIAPSSFGHGFQMAQFTPIPYLPASPMLPSPPTLYNPATFPYPNSPPTGFSTSAMRAGGAVPAGGFHGGGFHGGGGGFHGGAGGGHR